jgi:hypothetical protein
MNIKYSAILSMLTFALLQGCMQANDSTNPVSSLDQAKEIADSRFKAYSKAFNSQLSQIPEPLVTVREKDFIFVYDDKEVNKKITVIVDKDGGVAAGYQ